MRFILRSGLICATLAASLFRVITVSAFLVGAAS